MSRRRFGSLRAGDELAGPAVIEQFGSTVPIAPGFTARVDAFGNLVIGEITMNARTRRIIGVAVLVVAPVHRFPDRQLQKLISVC